MPRLLVNIDVYDIERAITFYSQAFGLCLGRRFDASFAELQGADTLIYLLGKAPGSAPFVGAERGRDYAPHWTPLHLDFVVDDLDAAVDRAVRAGATLEATPSDHAYGRLALCRDPFGHGFCLLEFRGRGYDELTRAPARG